MLLLFLLLLLPLERESHIKLTEFASKAREKIFTTKIFWSIRWGKNVALAIKADPNEGNGERERALERTV